MKNPAVDAADGLTSSGHVTESVQKALKRLGYPEVQEPNKPSTVLSKALTAVGKRLNKIDTLLKTFRAIAEPTALETKLLRCVMKPCSA